MADVEWPSGTLPTSPLYGWTETPGSSVIRTDTDTGPAKLRQRFTSAPSKFSMQFSMTTAQATRLIEFYSNAPDALSAGTAGGSLTFGTLPHPRTGEDATWRFLAPPVITQDTFENFRVSLMLERVV